MSRDDSKFINEIGNYNTVAVVFCFGDKYFGYTDEGLKRGWVDEISRAILWKKEIPGPEYIYCEDKLLKEQLLESKRKKVLKEVKYIIE